MAGRLNGEVAVITGAASGIGACTARRLVEEGARCVIADIDRELGARVAEELGEAAEFQPTDVTAEADVAAAAQRAVDRFGKLSIWFNSAGAVGAVGSVLDMPSEAWERTIAVNMTSVFYGIKHGAGHMKERGGSIVSMSSIAALRGGFGGHGYSTAKAGNIGLTMSAAAELNPYGIRVNCIAPGMVVTPLIDSLRIHMEANPPPDMPGAADTEAQWAIPAASPEDIASLVVFLASAESRHITGQALVVDGGSLTAPQPSVLTQLRAGEVGMRT